MQDESFKIVEGGDSSFHSEMTRETQTCSNERGNRMAENLKTSIRTNPNGDKPQVDTTAYIDPTAQVIGNVHIGARVYVGPNAVIRTDECDDKGQVQPVEIEAECNVQDGVTIHALGGTRVTIGRRTSLAHGCIIHGPCSVGQECFVGFRSVVYNAALENGVFISTGAVVQGVDLVENAFVPVGIAVLSGKDAGELVETSSADREFMKKVINANLLLAKGYNRPGEE
jgi:carbonic anhydrase/acetyltransferase-like protein (isoleucine patch superfamily)